MEEHILYFFLSNSLCWLGPHSFRSMRSPDMDRPANLKNSYCISYAGRFDYTD
jgi:hypothetical protein